MTHPEFDAASDDERGYEGFRDALGMPFECTVVRETERTVLKIRGGELDLSTEGAVRVPLLALLEERPPLVLIDVTELSFIDSSGIGMFVMAHRVAELQGSRIVFTGFQAQPLNALQISGLDQIFVIEP